MSRTLRRLVAGTVLAGTLAALAPAADATPRCFRVVGPDGRIYIVCV
ncbi:MAG TPA: hypothetical protein VF519_01635 [Mycobacteriales bacterium]|jgi:hypothetical protein